MKKTMIISSPNDMHVHFRDNEILKLVVPETDKIYENCIVMPNTVPPITNRKMAKDYKSRINKYIKNDLNPLMTLYLTEHTNADDMIRAYKDKTIFAVKLYPQGATTNSDKGVKDLQNIFPLLNQMENEKIPLLIHGEDTDEKIDIFDREKSFIDKYLTNIVRTFPKLKITLEHITTYDAIQFVKENKNLGASITPHHLASNRNDMLVGGIRPHLYCLPILKRKKHQEALIKVATSGNKKFFLGTDSAPHEIKNKENVCGCAGVFNTINSIEIITQIFDTENALSNLESFVSRNSALFYNIKSNKTKLELIKLDRPIHFDDELIKGKIKIKIYKPNFPTFWKINRKF